MGADESTQRAVQRNIAKCVAALSIDGGATQVKSTVDGILLELKVHLLFSFSLLLPSNPKRA
jgi:hypothetical protein